MVETIGVDVAFAMSIPTAVDDIVAFGTRQVDDRALGEWLRALVMLDWSTRLVGPVIHADRDESIGVLGPAFALNVPFFQTRAVTFVSADNTRHIRFRPTSTHLSAMFRGDVAPACDQAAKRLRQYGFNIPANLTPRQDRSAVDAALLPVPAAVVRGALHPFVPPSAKTDNIRQHTESFPEERS